MISTVEDLISHICDPINGIDHSKIEPRDKSVLFSLASQLRKSLSFTERQASLALKILERNRESYHMVDSFDRLIEVPVYKYSFRIIDTSKILSIITLNNTEYLSIKFPFDTKINTALLPVVKKTYDKNTKSYLMHLDETNIVRIVECLKDFDFVVDKRILDYYDRIIEIKKNPESYLPCLDYQDGLIFKNFTKSMTDYFQSRSKDSFLYDLLLCKNMGVHFSNDVKKKVEDLDIDALSKSMLLHNDRRFQIKTFNNIDVAKSLHLLDHWPILVIMSDDKDSINTISQWVYSLNNAGIDNNTMSVLFRSQVDKSFNDFVKDQQLNNLVTDKTKVVFIKHKMPKILYRINFEPKIIISLSNYYAHFTNQKIVDSHPLVLYYNNQSNMIGRNKIASL